MRRVVTFTTRQLLFGVAALLAGCSGPTSPTPAPAILAIAPSDDLLTVKTSVTYTVVGDVPGGRTRQGGAKWVTDNRDVAIVSAGGIVTGVGAGSTTLVATANGQTTSRVLRVVPDFTGTWSGHSQVTGCSAGDFRTCSRCCLTGQTHPVSLTLNQVRDAASGTLQLDAPASATTPMFVGPVSGPIQLAGSLVLRGTLGGQFSNGLVIAGPALFEWSTAIDPSGVSMIGSFTQITDAGFFFPTRVSQSLALAKTGR